MFKDGVSRPRTGSEDCPFGWGEIQAVLDGQRTSFQPSGDPPGAARDCEFCGNQTEWLWWSNAPINWGAGMCGRAGWVEICRDCRAWYAAHISIMS